MRGLALLALLTVPAQAADIPRMIEETASGIDQTYGGPWEFFVGGGAAAFDCNGDRLPDLAIAGGANPAKLYINRSDAGGALAFKEAPLGLDDRLSTRVTGFYPLDIDDDGHRDLVVLREGRNMLLRGDGACGFTPANTRWSFDGGRAWTTAFAAQWERGAAHPTLAFGNYVDRSAPGSPWGTCEDGVLLRPQGDDADSDAPDYSDPFALTPGHCALSMLFTDWNNSGEPSLRITNDRQYHLEGEDQLWRIPPTRAPRRYTSGDGWARLKIWGMGIAEADLDADGRPEYAITSMGDTKLQALDAEAETDGPTYTDLAYARGATAHRPHTGGDHRPSTGWHAEFADFNNDALLDLYIAKGNVEAMPAFAAFDPDTLLLGSWDDTFVEVGDAAGIALDRKGRGAAVADFNLDGALDLVVVNRGDPVTVFRNAGRSEAGRLGNWLMVELAQGGGNRDAVGARISARIGNRTLERRVAIGGGHASGRIGWVHLGMGVAERARVRVRWSDGDWSHPYEVFANNFVLIERGEPSVRYWYPPEVSSGPAR